MKKNIIVLDFETTSVDPDTCDIIQIGALAIDGARLEPIDDSEFYAWCKPDATLDDTYYQAHKSTIDFHTKNYNTNKDDFFNKLKGKPSEKQVVTEFAEYLKKYHTKASGQTKYTAPIVAAFNGFEFDFPILNRMAKKHGFTDKDGKQSLYFSRDSIDIMKLVVMWLSPLNELKSFSMDTVREYMGMPKGQSHDAKFDVEQESLLLIKFMRLHKQLAPRVGFKNAFARKELISI